MGKRKNPAPVVNPMGKVRMKKVVKQGSIVDEEIQGAEDLFFLEDDQLVELEKDAAMINPVLKNQFLGSLGTIGATALVGGLALAYDKYKNSQQEKKYAQALAQAVMFSPALKRYDMALLQSYMPMIIKASPTVASDPRLLANYLESMLDAEGHLNLSTFRELSGLENTVLTNNNMMNPWTTEMIKGVSKGIGQNLGEAAGMVGNKYMVGQYGMDERDRVNHAGTGNV